MSDTPMSDVVQRFFRYVQVDTQSADEHCDQVPSTACQFDLANLLADELRALGAEDAYVTESCYVVAHIPASKGAEDKPALGLLAHIDTTEAAPGFGVKPHIVHYEGGNLVAGVVDGNELLDLDYAEDSHAEIDMNLVATDTGEIVEIQGTGEQTPFDRKRLNNLLDLGDLGIKQLIDLQNEVTAFRDDD